MKQPTQYLGGKLFLILVGVMVVVFGVHTWLDIRTISGNLIDQVNSSAVRASDIIVRSVRYGMLLNRKQDVHQIIRTIGNEPGFVGINIYNKTGQIIFSTDSTTIGKKVDMHAEACVICHASGKPLASVPTPGRVRVYGQGPNGRVLGLINPIRNEAECYNAACHAHSTSQTVLGVLDVKMSLASVDQRVAAARRGIIVSAVVMALLIATVSGLFIYRFVRKPIQRLMRGMRTVSSGDLEAHIDVESNDELGELAGAFNRMAGELQSARGELEHWARTLEERIDEKTTELRRAQDQIIHMEKMASLGKLSASVAHEINNPLFSILTYAKLIQHGLGDEVSAKSATSIRNYAHVIQEESSRCGDIVRGLLDFARQKGGSFERHHVNEIVDRTLVILSHHLAMRRVDIHKEFLAANDELECDAKQIQQAIMAPCINSIEAMADGGTLTIRTRGDDAQLSIEIVDTGVGIPPEAMSRIFEPFFTTKEGEAGTGLGLAVTYGIVQRHRGRIDVASAPDQGTTFTIVLPRVHVREEEDVTL